MNFYLKCGTVLDEVSRFRGNVKTTIFNLLNKKFINKSEVRKIYSLCIQTLQNSAKLDDALSFLSVTKKVPIKNKNLAKVLLNELLFGKFKTVKGGGHLKKVLTENLPAIKKELNITDTDNGESQPKNKLIKSQVFIRIIQERVPLDYFKKFETENEIIIDNIVPNSLTMGYSAYQKLRELEDFNVQKTYVLQSKSSCLPPVCLRDYLAKFEIEDEFDIIDGCSAPGNKTLQIAEYFPKSKVFGVEKNPRRFQTLCERVKLYGLSNINCVNADFFTLDPEDIRFSKVKIIALDPSCSGTGMQNQLEGTKLDCDASNFEEKVAERWAAMASEDQNRIKKLGAMQFELLEHALKFPKLCYLVYSTCSIYIEENERVVKKLLKKYPKRLQLVSVLPKWEIRGFTSQFPGAKKCIREIPGRDSNDGFFVAMFRVTSAVVEDNAVKAQ